MACVTSRQVVLLLFLTFIDVMVVSDFIKVLRLSYQLQLCIGVCYSLVMPSYVLT